MSSSDKKPIGVFDSGYGGLTVLKEIVNALPSNDFIYLGDNARTPYGTRSFDTVYEYTLQSITALFKMGCELVIVACNTASAKALRSIQQNDLPRIAPHKRVLGVIRPTTEIVGNLSKTGHVGVLGTNGTVQSNSYVMEIDKFFPKVTVHQEACPMWVSLVENNEIETPGADYFIERHVHNLLAADKKIDTIILGCTHYPLLMDKIRKHIPQHVQLVSQGDIVATSLVDYLFRHKELAALCSKGSNVEFYTTDSTANFNAAASLFYGNDVVSKHLEL